MDLDSLKIEFQLNLANDSIQNMAWGQSGQRLLFTKAHHVMIFTMGADSAEHLPLPFDHYLSPIGWAPIKGYLAFLISYGNKLRQVFYDITTHEKIVLPTELSPAIKNFHWSFWGKNVAYCIPDSSLISVYQYQNRKLKPQGTFPLFVSLFRWMQSNTTLRNRIGDYALFKSDAALGLFYFDKKQWNWLPGLPAKNITGFSWASDGQNIFYILKGNGNNDQIIREQIIYAEK